MMSRKQIICERKKELAQRLFGGVCFFNHKEKFGKGFQFHHIEYGDDKKYSEFEELKWPQPYKKGDKPIRELDGKPHVCQNQKPQEISASSQTVQKPKNEKADWGDWDFKVNGRTGYYKCLKCPHHSGIFNKNEPDFDEKLKIHNEILHPFKNDFSMIEDVTTNSQMV
ncbi:MAG: hypothetical protein HZC29_01740 [Thaumarchaeota archaeon]|nr:hypothetical protein [Nitrososphaerota archaeon]